MRVVAIIGEPGTGKSTIVRKIIEGMPLLPFKEGLLRGVWSKSMNLYVFGSYDPDEKFPGTDRLSMAVQPDASRFLEFVRTTNPLILFEGDRLGNAKFLEFCQMIADVKLFHISAEPAAKNERRRFRGDTMKESFLKGRVTKIANLITDFEHQTLRNNHPGDLEKNAVIIREAMGL